MNAMLWLQHAQTIIGGVYGSRLLCAIAHIGRDDTECVETYAVCRYAVLRALYTMTRVARHFPVGVSWRQAEPAILAAAITACVRLSTPSFCRIAETCALMVASETPSS